VTSASAVVTVQPIQVANPPAILTHPASQSLAPGVTLELKVTATGEGPLSYRWQFNGFNIPGASQDSFTLVDAQPTDSGDYQVVVSNAGGSVTSEVAQVKIVEGPSILQGPVSQTVQTGQQMVLSVEASGTPPLNYQWRYQGFNIPGARGSTFQIDSVQLVDAGAYQVVVSDASGAQVQSLPALLDVVTEPVNTSRITSVQLSDGGLLIQWEAKEGRVLQAKARLEDAIWRDIPGSEGQSESRQALLGNATFYRLLDR